VGMSVLLFTILFQGSQPQFSQLKPAGSMTESSAILYQTPRIRLHEED